VHTHTHTQRRTHDILIRKAVHGRGVHRCLRDKSRYCLAHVPRTSVSNHTGSSATAWHQPTASERSDPSSDATGLAVRRTDPHAAGGALSCLWLSLLLMPLLSVAGLVAQGKLTRVPLPEGEALRSAVAGSMQQHAMELAGQLSPVFDAIAEAEKRWREEELYCQRPGPNLTAFYSQARGREPGLRLVCGAQAAIAVNLHSFRNSMTLQGLRI